MPPKNGRDTPGAMLEEVPPSALPCGERLGKGNLPGAMLRGRTVVFEEGAGDRLAEGKTDFPGDIGETFMKAHGAAGRIDLMGETIVSCLVRPSGKTPLLAGEKYPRQGAEEGESQNRFGGDRGEFRHNRN